MLGRMWVFPPAAATISFFLLFHFRIHVMLQRCKLKAEAEISTLLDQTFQEWKASRDEKQQETMTKLIQWREIIRNASEWPMRLQSVLATIATLLLPTVKTIVELVTK
jgi:hypothetical protein